MSIARLRNQLEALERKLALPLAVIRAKRVAQDICDHWAKAQADQKPLPTPFEVVQMAREAGIRYASFMDLNLYIQRCLKEKRSPEPEGFLHSVLPRASANGMVRAAMQRDSASSDPSPRRSGETPKPLYPAWLIAFPQEIAKYSAMLIKEARATFTRGKIPRPRGRYRRTRILPPIPEPTPQSTSAAAV